MSDERVPYPAGPEAALSLQEALSLLIRTAGDTLRHAELTEAQYDNLNDATRKASRVLRMIEPAPAGVRGTSTKQAEATLEHAAALVAALPASQWAALIVAFLTVWEREAREQGEEERARLALELLRDVINTRLVKGR